MKNKVTSQAKRETFLNQLKNGNLKTKKLKILDYIKNNPYTNTDNIRTNLSIPHQTATGIISHLLDLGLIAITGETQSKSSSFSNYVFIEDFTEQDNLSKQREKEKFEIWLKQGINNFEKHCSSQLFMYLVMEKNNL